MCNGKCIVWCLGGLLLALAAAPFAAAATVLTWDGNGNGNWDDINPVTGFSRWLNQSGNQVRFFPDATMEAVVNANQVTVARNQQVGRLTVNDGSIRVGDNVTLAVVGAAEIGSAAPLVLGRGAQLTLGSELGMLDSLIAGDGSIIQGSVLVRGTLSPGNSLGTLTIRGGLELYDTATCAIEVGRSGSDLINIVTGDMSLAGALSLSATDIVKGPAKVGQDPPVPSWGTTSRTINSAGEGRIYWTFAEESIPRRGDHLGHGVLFDSLQYDWINPDNPEEGATGVSVEVFQAAPGDTATRPPRPGDPVHPLPDREINADDIQRILSETKFETGRPADWSQGDFNDDGLCDSSDIQLILASALFNAGPYGAAVAFDAGLPLGAGLPTSPAAFDAQWWDSATRRPTLRITPAGLVIDTAGRTINGYILSSAAGVFTGAAADNLGLFSEDGDRRIGGQMFFALNGTHLLGNVVGSEWSGVDLTQDVSMTYTVEGRPGIYAAAVVVPQPTTVLTLLGGLLFALLVRRRPRPA